MDDLVVSDSSHRALDLMAREKPDMLLVDALRLADSLTGEQDVSRETRESPGEASFLHHHRCQRYGDGSAYLRGECPPCVITKARQLVRDYSTDGARTTIRDLLRLLSIVGG